MMSGCGKNEGFGMHEYSEVKCPLCGEVFCFNCCSGTNIHYGGGYNGEYMICPRCGVDIYDYEEE